MLPGFSFTKSYPLHFQTKSWNISLSQAKFTILHISRKGIDREQQSLIHGGKHEKPVVRKAESDYCDAKLPNMHGDRFIYQDFCTAALIK